MKSYCYSLLFSFLLILLCGCGTTVECIDADDWGDNLKVTVNSYSDNAIPVNPSKPNGDQYVNWTPGFQLTGQPIVMVIDNTFNQTYDGLNCSNQNNFTQALNSWRFILSSNSVTSQSPFKCTNSVCPPLPLCSFDPASPYPWFPTGYSMVTDDLPDTNTPCVLNMGLGLYSKIVKYTGNSPNAPSGKSLACDTNIADNKNCILHIGNNACTNSADLSNCGAPFISQGCPAGGAAFNPPSDCLDTTTSKCFIYLKILDRYYSDNYGQYTVKFKQGVMKGGSPGIITTFVGMVQGILCTASESEFVNLVKENSYLTYIRVLLILYIIFLGIGYLSGFVEASHTELLVRVFKIALVIQITTTNASWDFFYSHFFKFFTNGIGEITGIIFGDAIVNTKISIPGVPESASCSFQNLSGFASFDQILKQLLSYETSRKIMSLIAWKGGGYIGGILLVFIIYCLIILVLFIMLKSVMIYIMSYLAISLLIILSPIFIPFILFNVTRHWFDNWLKNLISYFVQPIIILTFAFFLLQIFMYQMQYLFGYRVCFKDWFNFVSKDNKFLHLEVFAWQTDFANPPTKHCIFTPNELMAPKDGTLQINTENNKDINKTLPSASFTLAKWPHNECTPNHNYYGDTVTAGSPEYCTPYTCTQMRYPEYPYLNPNIDVDNARIQELQNDQLMSFKDLGIFVLIVWFMWQFNNVVPSIARRLSGNPQAQTNLASAGAAMTSSLFKWGGKAVVATVANPIYRRAFGNHRDLVKDVQLAQRRINQHLDKIGGTIETVQKAVPSATSFLNPMKPLEKRLGTVGEKTTGKLLAKKDAAKEFAKGGLEAIKHKIEDKYKQLKAGPNPNLPAGGQGSATQPATGPQTGTAPQQGATSRSGVGGTAQQAGAVPQTPLQQQSTASQQPGANPTQGQGTTGGPSTPPGTGSSPLQSPPQQVQRGGAGDAGSHGAATSSSSTGKTGRSGVTPPKPPKEGSE